MIGAVTTHTTAPIEPPEGRPLKQKLINWEIAVYALHLSGGASKPVRTEDVALKCFELAPESFSWVHYPQYPDKEIARFGLTDARKAKTGALVTGRAGKGIRPVPQSKGELSTDGWMLNEAGVKWVLSNEERLSRELGQKGTNYQRQELLRKIRRVRTHRLFATYRSAPEQFKPSLGELADLLRCRVDAEQAIWSKRIDLLKNQALLAQQDDVISFVLSCETRIRELIGK